MKFLYLHSMLIIIGIFIYVDFITDYLQKDGRSLNEEEPIYMRSYYQSYDRAGRGRRKEHQRIMSCSGDSRIVVVRHA